MAFDVHEILNVVGQLGGNHQQAAQEFSGQGQIDPQQHAGLLQKFGIDPQQLTGGGYDQHLQAQQDPGVRGLPARPGPLRAATLLLAKAPNPLTHQPAASGNDPLTKEQACK